MCTGSSRNAGDYFKTGVAAAFIGRRLEDTVVIAPRFAVSGDGICNDKLAPGEISWSCRDSWIAGGEARNVEGLESFQFVDAILRLLADREVFPNLEVVVVAGHSAGGQFVARYAAATSAPASLPYAVRFVIANPSSYLYFTADRLPTRAECTAKGKCTAPFAPFDDIIGCPSFNDWRYGLANRKGPIAAIDTDALRTRFISSAVTYLLGELDTLQDRYLDRRCAAMAQGPNRLARGLNYWNYLRSRFGAKHNLVVIPACGHNNRCMFTSDDAMPVLFPDVE